MISAGDRDEIKGLGLGLGLGLGSRRREMVEFELEEGEAFSYQNREQDFDTTVDPDVALSYIDDKIQDVLGHFQKDFEGGVSAENLGAKFGGYGSFLPTYQRSPAWTHPRTPQKNHSQNSPRSPNNLHSESGQVDAVQCSTGTQLSRLGPGSATSSRLAAIKGLSLDDGTNNESCMSITNAEALNSKYQSLNTKAASISDQKTLKVRIKIPDDLSTRKNAAIYSGLGLDVSPSSSPDDSPSESEGVSRGPLDAPFESPTSILKIITTFPVPLSPLPDDLIELTEKEVRTRDSIPGLVHIDDPESSGMLLNESNIVKGDRKLLGGKKVKSLEDYESSMEFKGCSKKNTRNDVGRPSRKEQAADALTMEELVSNTMKLPLLSNLHSLGEDSVKDVNGTCNSLKEANKGVVKEKTLSDQAQKEGVDQASSEVNGFSERAKGGSGRKVVGDKVLLDDTKVRTTSNTECVEPPKKPNQKRGSLGEQDSTTLPFVTEHSYPAGKKKSKGIHDTVIIEREKENMKVGSSSIPKTKRSTDDSYTSRNEIEDVKVQKGSGKARDAYRDFFGELEEDEDKTDSPETPYEAKPKESEAVERSTPETNLGAKETSGGKKMDKSLTAEVYPRTATNVWCTGIAPSTDAENGNGVPAILPPVEMEDNWVQCDRCHKWRLLPAGTNPDSLPEKWLCSMLNWLPDMNRCSFSEDETTKALFSSLYQVHSLDAQSNPQNISGSVMMGGTGSTFQHPGQRHLNNDMHAVPGGKKKIAKEISSVNAVITDGVSHPSYSIKKNMQSSVKSRSLNDVNKSPVVSEADAPGERHKNKPRMPEYNSDRGDAKNKKSRRDPDQDCSRPSKKGKTDKVHSADKDWIPEQNGTGRKISHSSNNTMPTTSAGKDRPRQKGRSSSSDSKFRKDRPPVSTEKRNDKGQGSLDEGSLDLGNYGSIGSVKKRKLKEYQDAQTRSTGNPRPHESRISEHEFSDSRKEKKARNSRSEGKESSASKGSGRTDKKVSHTKNQNFRQNPGSNHSHRSMDRMDSSKRDLGSVQVSVAATSSSSKVSGSHKTKASFQEVKGSPVESVSSSPLRILSTDKLSNREIMGKDEPHNTAAVDSPRRCLDGEDDGASDRSETARKDKSFTMAHRSDFQGKGVDHTTDTKPKGQTSSHYPDSGAETVALEYPAAEQIKHHGEDRTGVYYANDNVSHARKTGTQSGLEENKQGCKSEPPKVKVKSSSSPSQLPDQSPLHDANDRDEKVKLEKFGLNPDQNENIASKKDLTVKNESRKKENHVKREHDIQEVRIDALCKQEPLHAPGKNQLADRDTGRSSKRSLSERPADQEVLGKGKSQVETLSHCPRPAASSQKGNGDMEVDPAKVDDASKLQKKQFKKADHINGTQQIGSRNPALNGHRSKEPDAPSPVRKDSYSHAANNAVREAKDLKHLADRLKNSGSTLESTNLYFQAALKFLNGASLLESGNNDNAKHNEMIQSKQMYSSTAKLCEFCAHEYEKSKDMASAALAYKCTEVAYMRVIYSSHTSASRDRHELQTALQMIPLGESPSSSASDVDNVNNPTVADKVALSKSVNSPQVAGNHVISARSRPNFVRILNYAQDVNFAMEASRKSRNAFAAAKASLGVGKNSDGISSIKKALDFSFQDVEGLLRLVRLAVEAINR